MKKFFVIINLAVFFAVNAPIFADTSSSSSKKGTEITLPQWAKDARRTEIITFGSLPFVTLWATMGYTYYTYGELRNPLDKSSDGLTSTDQKEILKIAGVTCLCLGLSDLTLNLIERRVKKSRERRMASPERIEVLPFNEALPPPAMEEKKENHKEYLINGVLEDALF